MSFVFKGYQLVQILRYGESEVCDKQLLSGRFVTWKLQYSNLTVALSAS